MSKYVWVNPKRFAVVCRWKDNENDFQVLEYFQTTDECKTYISAYPKRKDYNLEIAKYN